MRAVPGLSSSSLLPTLAAHEPPMGKAFLACAAGTEGLVARSLKNTLRIGSCALALVLALASTESAAISIDFEDGTGHDNPIPSNHYSGLTFSNAVWIQAVFPFGTVADGSFGLGVDAGVGSSNDWAFPGVASPIVITFDGPDLPSQFSIQAFDVGAAGAFLEAFDSIGDSLGTVAVPGSGPGSGFNPLLSISAPGIKTVHLRQISFDSQDGLGWDNLVAVPEPSTALLCGLGLMLLAARRP